MLKISAGGPILGRIKLLFGNRIIQRGCQTAKNEESAAALNRLEFRNIPVSPEILKYLDIHRLGYISKRKARVNVAKKFDDGAISREDNRARPYPFFKNKGKLSHTAHDETQIPPCSESHEIAVIGRSNVGKSSLLNSLLGFNSSFVQKSIVSAKPGETRVLRFYGLGVNKNAKEKNVSALTLVDMPGYGFAYMKEETKMTISNLVYKYLFSSAAPKKVVSLPKHSSDESAAEVAQIIPRPSLKRVLLLVDARHGLKLTDKEFFEQLASACARAHAATIGGNGNSRTNAASYSSSSWKVQVVMTKCDLVERTELCRRITLLNTQLKELVAPFKMHNLLHLPIVPVSLQSHGGGPSGISELCFQLNDLLPKKLRKPIKTTNYSSSESMLSSTTSTSTSTTRGPRSDGSRDGSNSNKKKKFEQQRNDGRRNSGGERKDTHQRTKNRIVDSPRRRRREGMAPQTAGGDIGGGGDTDRDRSNNSSRREFLPPRKRSSSQNSEQNNSDVGLMPSSSRRSSPQFRAQEKRGGGDSNSDYDSGTADKQRRMNRKQRREARRQKEGEAFGAMAGALDA